jgi:hypothetical protein
MFAPDLPNMPQDVKQVADETMSRLGNVKVSVQQARLPSISLQAAMNKEYLSLTSQYPDHVEAIDKYFKGHGFQPSMALQTFNDLQDQHEAEREQGQEFEKKMFEAGAATLDPQILSSMSREQVIAQGVSQTKAETELELATKQANLVLTNKNISEAEKKAVEEDRDSTIVQTFTMDAYNQSNPIMTALQGAMVSIGKLPIPEQQKAFQLLAPKYDQWSANYKAKVLAQASASGVKGSAYNDLSTRLDDIVDRGRTMWSGDMSVAKANMNGLQALQVAAKVDFAKAMPVYFAMQQMGFSPQEIEGMVPGITANPKLQESLRKELNGFTGDFGQERASTRLMNILRILKGEAKLPDFDPKTARDLMPSLYESARTLSKAYNQGVEGVGTDKVLNSTGTLITAARAIGSTQDLLTWQKATSGIANGDTRQALIKAKGDAASNDMAEATIKGSLAASAHILDQMRSYKDQYNKNGWTLTLKDGRMVATQKEATIHNSGGSGFMRAEGGLTTHKLLPIPSDTQAFMNVWNTNIDNIVLMSKHDPSAVKATPLETAQFYSGQKIPDAFKLKEDKGIDPQAEIQKQFDIIENAFNSIPDMNQNVSPAAARPRVMNYEAAAAGFNEVPASVKTLGQASDFAKQVNKAGVASSAMGTYQIVGATLRQYAPKVFGENWQGAAFTADNQEKIAEAIFKDHRHSAEALSKQWVSLTRKEAEVVRKLPWSQAKHIIARGESG